MKKVTISGLLALTAAMGTVAQAAPTASKVSKAQVRVVAGAKALSTADKANITGMCGCPEPVSKPGYGFGAPVEHYGPPGQGFNPYWTWRQQREQSAYTPNGTAMPPTAFKVD